MYWFYQVHILLDLTVYDALRVVEDRMKWLNIVRTTLIDGGDHDPQTWGTRLN